MSTLVIPMSSPGSLKRTFDEAGLEASLEEYHAQQSSQSPSHEPQTIGEKSTPASAPLTFTVSDPPLANGPIPIPTTNPTPNPQLTSASMPSTTKKHKMTFVEKEAKRIEKEFKEQQKAEERARKEEERIRKEEEKAKREEERAKKIEEKKVRDAEKEEKRKAREEKERLREEEKAKREQERRQKEEQKDKKARVCCV